MKKRIDYIDGVYYPKYKSWCLWLNYQKESSCGMSNVIFFKEAGAEQFLRMNPEKRTTDRKVIPFKD